MIAHTSIEGQNILIHFTYTEMEPRTYSYPGCPEDAEATKFTLPTPIGGAEAHQGFPWFEAIVEMLGGDESVREICLDEVHCAEDAKRMEADDLFHETGFRVAWHYALLDELDTRRGAGK